MRGPGERVGPPLGGGVGLLGMRESPSVGLAPRGMRGPPGAWGGSPGEGARHPHLPVAPLEDHREGAVPDQVLARELELAHGLQAAAAGLHGAGRAGRVQAAARGRGGGLGARAIGQAGPSPCPAADPDPAPVRPGSEAVSDPVPTGAPARFGLGV